MSENYKAALEIVKAQASVRAMSVEEITAMVQALVKNLDNLAAGVTVEAALPDAATQAKAGKLSIKEKCVTCLECGKNFKIITSKHLASHGLTKNEYLEKYGLKKGTSLVSKGLARERKKKMKSMELWKRKGKKSAGEMKPAASK